MMLEELLQESLAPIVLDASELQRLATSLQSYPARSIRRDKRRTSQRDSFFEGLESVPWYTGGYWWDESRGRPGNEPLYAAGGYFIQDAASMLPLTLLNAQPGETICDLCAAPGGKATAIAETLTESGWLLANETIQSRLAPLELNLARTGSSRYITTHFDPEQLADRLPEEFDGILVDAPCSGQTLIGKGKQSFSSMNASAIDLNAARQTRILDAAARLVRPGGRLVYSTCTLATAENERQVEAFLLRHPDWRLASPARLLEIHQSRKPEVGGAILCDVAAFLSRLQSPVLAGCYRLWPQRDRCAGGFAALLERQHVNDLPDSTLPPPAERKSRTKQTQRAENRSRIRSKEWNSEIPVDFSPWGSLEFATLATGNQQSFAWPEEPPPGWIDLMHGGPEIAYRKGSQWFPAHALAFRYNWTPRSSVPLSAEQTIRFVAGEAIDFRAQLSAGRQASQDNEASQDKEASNVLEGWGIATWQGLPLGWLKVVGGVGKNHIPKSARLHLSNS